MVMFKESLSELHDLFCAHFSFHFNDQRQPMSNAEEVVNPCNLFQSSVAFHIETSHLISTTNLMTGFYIKRTTGMKWLKAVIIITYLFCIRSC